MLLIFSPVACVKVDSGGTVAGKGSGLAAGDEPMDGGRMDDGCMDGWMKWMDGWPRPGRPPKYQIPKYTREGTHRWNDEKRLCAKFVGDRGPSSTFGCRG